MDFYMMEWLKHPAYLVDYLHGGMITSEIRDTPYLLMLEEIWNLQWAELFEITQKENSE